MTVNAYKKKLDAILRSGQPFPEIVEADGTTKTAKLRKAYGEHPIGRLGAARLSIASSMKQGLDISVTAPAQLRSYQLELLIKLLDAVNKAELECLAFQK